MTLTIRHKLTIAYISVFGAVLLIFAIIIYQNLKQIETERIESALRSYSTILKAELEEQTDDNQSIDIQGLRAVKAEGLVDTRLALFDDSGRKIFSDSLALLYPGNVKGQRGTEWFETIKNKSGENLKALYCVVECRNGSVYHLLISASMKESDSAMGKFLLIIAILIPLALILSTITSLKIAKASFKPVIKMTGTAKEISAKNLDKRIELPDARDEIFQLGITLNEMIDRLENAFKSQRQFVSDASHEIRTPLTIIRAELELLERSISDIQAKSKIGNALTEIDILTNLTSSLLALAKVDSSKDLLKPENLFLDELITENIQPFNLTAGEKNITFSIEMSEQVVVNGDKDKLRSIFFNLTDNAVKYSFPGTVISISIGKSGNFAVIKYLNKGTPVSADEINRIFDRFYRSVNVPAESRGNGLGLCIVKEFVELHGGSVSAERNVDSGTLFTVKLPAISL